MSCDDDSLVACMLAFSVPLGYSSWLNPPSRLIPQKLLQHCRLFCGHQQSHSHSLLHHPNSSHNWQVYYPCTSNYASSLWKIVATVCACYWKFLPGKGFCHIVLLPSVILQTINRGMVIFLYCFAKILSPKYSVVYLNLAKIFLLWSVFAIRVLHVHVCWSFCRCFAHLYEPGALPIEISILRIFRVLRPFRAVRISGLYVSDYCRLSAMFT